MLRCQVKFWLFLKLFLSNMVKQKPSRPIMLILSKKPAAAKANYALAAALDDEELNVMIPFWCTECTHSPNTACRSHPETHAPRCEAFRSLPWPKAYCRGKTVRLHIMSCEVFLWILGYPFASGMLPQRRSTERPICRDTWTMPTENCVRNCSKARYAPPGR